MVKYVKWDRGLQPQYDMRGISRHDYMVVNLLAISECVNDIALVDVRLDRVGEIDVRVYQKFLEKNPWRIH